MRTIENVTIPAISPRLSPPVLISSCFSPIVVVGIVVIAAVDVFKIIMKTRMSATVAETGMSARGCLPRKVSAWGCMHGAGLLGTCLPGTGVKYHSKKTINHRNIKFKRVAFESDSWEYFPLFLHPK